MSRKGSTQVSCCITNETPVLRSAGSEAQKGLVEEQERRKTKGERLNGDTAQPNEQNLKERSTPSA
jgi:hypothetical protein